MLPRRSLAGSGKQAGKPHPRRLKIAMILTALSLILGAEGAEKERKERKERKEGNSVVL
jgi:hypothetical protein